MDNTFVNAKFEYTKQLQSLLNTRIYEGFESIYNDSVKTTSNQNEVLKNFQKFLKDIPKWNQDIINDEMDRIIRLSECSFMDKLLAAIFISNTRILSSIKKKKKGNINIQIPKLSHFIHRCYLETAREFYKNPYLFDKFIKSSKEKQSNMRTALSIIDDCILVSIRSLMPFNNILNEYINYSQNINTTFENNDYDQYVDSMSENSLDLNDIDNNNENNDEYEYEYEDDNNNRLHNNIEKLEIDQEDKTDFVNKKTIKNNHDENQEEEDKDNEDEQDKDEENEDEDEDENDQEQDNDEKEEVDDENDRNKLVNVDNKFNKELKEVLDLDNLKDLDELDNNDNNLKNIKEKKNKIFKNKIIKHNKKKNKINVLENIDEYKKLKKKKKLKMMIMI